MKLGAENACTPGRSPSIFTESYEEWQEKMLLSDCGGDALKGDSQDLQYANVFATCGFPLQSSRLLFRQAL